MEKTIITKILFNLGYFFISMLVERKDNKIDTKTLHHIKNIYDSFQELKK